MDFTELYCDVDDFCQVFEPFWQQKQITSGERHRKRSASLSLSERMTIMIAFHASNHRDFKHYYLLLMLLHRADFPKLVSYTRFVQSMPALLIPLCAYLQTRYGKNTGIAFIDSTALAVCGCKRIQRNRVFAEYAKRGKTTMGWFFGFKLHLVINECGELLGVTLTPGNVDDRTPVPFPDSSNNRKAFRRQRLHLGGVVSIALGTGASTHYLGTEKHEKCPHAVDG